MQDKCSQLNLSVLQISSFLSHLLRASYHEDTLYSMQPFYAAVTDLLGISGAMLDLVS